MTMLDTVAKKLNNGEAVNAVQYVRLEHFSKKARNKIVAKHGTKICQNFLAEHPNITLVETPYIDSGYLPRSIADREALLEMFVKLKDKDVNLVLVDDFHELASSYVDVVVTENVLFEGLDAVVLDMKHGLLCASVEAAMKFFLGDGCAE